MLDSPQRKKMSVFVQLPSTLRFIDNLKVLEIHEDLEDLYQKRHTWQRPSVPDETQVWTGQKFALPKGDDAQSVYSKDNNGIPKNPLNQVHPGSIPNPAFHQVINKLSAPHYADYFVE